LSAAAVKQADVLAPDEAAERLAAATERHELALDEVRRLRTEAAATQAAIESATKVGARTTSSASCTRGSGS
jgi:hypothetical protein